MRTRMSVSGLKIAAALAVAGTSLLPLIASSSEASSGADRLFTGGGYGATPTRAVQAAIGDAENSASAEQLYSCEVVGEPLVFPRRNSPRGPSFNAEATVRCTP